MPRVVPIPSLSGETADNETLRYEPRKGPKRRRLAIDYSVSRRVAVSTRSILRSGMHHASATATSDADRKPRHGWRRLRWPRRRRPLRVSPSYLARWRARFASRARRQR